MDKTRLTQLIDLEDFGGALTELRETFQELGAPLVPALQLLTRPTFDLVVRSPILLELLDMLIIDLEHQVKIRRYDPDFVTGVKRMAELKALLVIRTHYFGERPV